MPIAHMRLGIVPIPTSQTRKNPYSQDIEQNTPEGLTSVVGNNEH